MVLVKRVFCCKSLYYGNLMLALFAATFYLTSIVWLLLIYDKFLAVNSSRYLAIFVIVLSSVHLTNCVLLAIGILFKQNCLIFPWLLGQLLAISASIIVPIFLIVVGTITNVPLTIAIMVVLNLYQLYHLICVYSMYMRNSRRGDHQSSYEPLD